MKTTDASVWTPASQLKSRAIGTLSKLKSLILSLNSEISSTSDRVELRRLGVLLMGAKQSLADSMIEQSLARANHKQLEMVDAFGSGDWDTVAFVSANQTGKSWAAGRMCIAKWLRDHARNGQIVWVISPTIEKSVSGPQKELWESLPRRMFGKVEYDAKNGYGGQRPTLILPTRDGGSVVVRFKTAAQYDSDPRSFEQEAVDLIWIDESIDEHVYDALLPRCVARNARILLSCIPDLPWMFDRFENARPGNRVKFITAGIEVNRMNLAPGAIESMAARMDEDEAQMRIFGRFRFLSGVVYKEFVKEYAPEGHLCKPFNVPADWPRWRGLDWGNRHPTACLWVALSPNETAYIYREYYRTDRAVQVHARHIVSQSVGEKFLGPTICDPSLYNRNQSNVNTIADEFKRFGLPLRPARRATRNYTEWAQVQKVKAWLLDRSPLGPRLQIFDTCENLVWELRRWKYKTDKDNKPLDSDAFEDKHNDLCDCLRYVLCANPSHHPHAVEVVDTLA